MRNQRTRHSDRLQRDGWLFPWKVTAGVLSVIFLGGLMVTSMNRGPNDVWIFITAGTAVLISVSVWRALRRSRRVR